MERPRQKHIFHVEYFVCGESPFFSSVLSYSWDGWRRIFSLITGQIINFNPVDSNRPSCACHIASDGAALVFVFPKSTLCWIKLPAGCSGQCDSFWTKHGQSAALLISPVVPSLPGCDSSHWMMFYIRKCYCAAHHGTCWEAARWPVAAPHFLVFRLERMKHQPSVPVISGDLLPNNFLKVCLICCLVLVFF